MSSVSSASGTIPTQLTDSFFTTNPQEFYQCMKFNFKMIFAMCFAILLLCLCISCLNSVLKPSQIATDYEDDVINYDPALLNIKCNCVNNKCKCHSNMIETFSNDEIYSYKSAQASNYQNIPLLAPNNENLFFGQAKRYITSVDKILNYRLEIYCNLLVLDGNIYDKYPPKTVKQRYSVKLRNSKSNDVLEIGDLEKDGDGIYKLKYKTQQDVENLVKYDTVDIVYLLYDNEQLLLRGKFN